MDKDKWSIGEGGELPIGFGLNLSTNAEAMKVFSNMTDQEKQRIVEESKHQHSKSDMERFVNKLGESI